MSDLERKMVEAINGIVFPCCECHNVPVCPLTTARILDALAGALREGAELEHILATYLEDAAALARKEASGE